MNVAHILNFAECAIKWRCEQSRMRQDSFGRRCQSRATITELPTCFLHQLQIQLLAQLSVKEALRRQSVDAAAKGSERRVVCSKIIRIESEMCQLVRFPDVSRCLEMKYESDLSQNNVPRYYAKRAALEYCKKENMKRHWVYKRCNE